MFGLTKREQRWKAEQQAAEVHAPFLAEAKRVLKHDGLVFAKIKDYVHNHKYQWNLELFNAAVREAGLMPCDLIIKRDPCGGNLKSGRWQRAHHAKNTHCFWVVVRNSKRCEPKASNVGMRGPEAPSGTRGSES